MKHAVIKARSLRGDIHLPGDKSISHRLLLFAALAQSESVLSGLLESDDIRATKTALESLGVQFSEVGGRLHVTPPPAGLQGSSSTPIQCGNSGTTMRLLAGLLAGQGIPSTLIGDPSLTRRPMARIQQPLTAMGARIRCVGNNGRPPIQIQSGVCRGLDCELPISSAQVKSAIMLAGLAYGVRIREPRQSRDHTERLLTRLGACFIKDDLGWLELAPVRPWQGFTAKTPRDFSSATFWLVAGSIVPQSKIRMDDVGLNPTRTGALDVLTRMGASVDVTENTGSGSDWEPTGTLTASTAPLKGIRIAGELALRCIDEIPILAIAAAFGRGATEFRDVGELRYKESDRIHMVADGLRQMGVDVVEFDDGLRVVGGRPSRSCVIDCKDDHRIAMSFAIASAAGADVKISGAQSVQTSYPDFFHDLERLSV